MEQLWETAAGNFFPTAGHSSEKESKPKFLHDYCDTCPNNPNFAQNHLIRLLNFFLNPIQQGFFDV